MVESTSTRRPVPGGLAWSLEGLTLTHEESARIIGADPVGDGGIVLSAKDDCLRSASHHGQDRQAH
jgi:hypothetical protein